jgi:RNA polymerase sigma-70 factor (ECF subfamily)
MGSWTFGRRARERNRFDIEAMPHLDAAYRFALSMTRDAAEADDLVQETFLKALRSFDTFTEGTNCKAWLFRILRNTWINRLRSGSREVMTDEAMEAIQDASLAGWDDRAFYRTPHESSVLRATRDEILAALQSLPGDFRQAVVLSDVEGMSYKEIADVMGTPIGTVMSRLYRGRRLMRRRLAKSLGLEEAGEDDEAGGEVLSLFGTRAKGEAGHGL